jgi:hypothetical protein
MGFGSLAALTTTADVALQIALAGGLGRAGAGAAGIINGGLSERLYKKAKQSGRNVSRGVLTAMSKRFYNEAIENGYTTSEASVITELWLLLCGKLLNTLHIGDYEVKVLRENIKTAMKTEQEGLLKSCLHQLLKKP